MDIIVTTPKTEIENGKKEASDVLKNGGGVYFRVLSKSDIAENEINIIGSWKDHQPKRESKI